MSSQDATTLTREADALRAAGRLEEAALRYGAAVVAEPRAPWTERNLATCLGEMGRWAEAEAHIRSAFTKGIDEPDAWLARARCEAALGRPVAAEQAYREALARAGGWREALRELTQLLWMRDADVAAATRDLDAAIAQAQDRSFLPTIKADLLEAAGDLEAALAILARLSGKHPDDPWLDMQASRVAAGLGLSGKALDLAQRAYAKDGQQFLIVANLVEALLGVGEAQKAADLAGDIRRRWSTLPLGVALQATAWRMLGDRRSRALSDHDALTGVETLDVPPGWKSVEAYVSDLAAALAPLHQMKEAPFGDPLRHGSRVDNVLHHHHPPLKSLPLALDGAIRRRLALLGAGDDPARARNRGTYGVARSWSAQIRPGGYQRDHVSHDGWLSAVCFIAAPEGTELRLGQPGVRTHPTLEAEKRIAAKPGTLAVFPAFMWRGIAPLGGKQHMLTLSFDLVPGPVELAED